MYVIVSGCGKALIRVDILLCVIIVKYYQTMPIDQLSERVIKSALLTYRDSVCLNMIGCLSTVA